MSQIRRLKFDEIGYWSEIKLDIVKEYASAYSQILSAQNKPPLHHVYIDAFAGAGMHISKRGREYVAGSPINALLTQPAFKDHYLIDIDGQKVALLRELTRQQENVHIYEGDCNSVLLDHVFPKRAVGAVSPRPVLAGSVWASFKVATYRERGGDAHD
jgi:three-Cys-motif partner protein